MPVKKTKRNKKINIDFSMILIFSIFFVFTVYVILAWMLGGVSLLWRFTHPEINVAQIPQEVSVEYNTDKNAYLWGENIKLALVNNYNSPLYLVPCQYFNIEKKTADKAGGVKWVPLGHIDKECQGGAVQIESTDSFEKVSKTVEQYLPTLNLDVGAVYRSVSKIYLGCSKPSIGSCQGSTDIYSNEFVIKGNGADSSSNRLK